MQPSGARSASTKVPRETKNASLRQFTLNIKLFPNAAGLGGRVKRFRGNETVFLQGDPAQNVMYIQDGGLKLTVINEVGKEAVVAILGRGNFVGLGALAGQ